MIDNTAFLGCLVVPANSASNALAVLARRSAKAAGRLVDNGSAPEPDPWRLVLRTPGGPVPRKCRIFLRTVLTLPRIRVARGKPPRAGASIALCGAPTHRLCSVCAEAGE